MLQKSLQRKNRIDFFRYRSICITDLFPHILIKSYELVSTIDRCLCQAWRSASPPVRAGSSRWCPNIQVSHIEHSIRQFIFHWKMRVEGIYTNVELGRNATMGKRKRLESQSCKDIVSQRAIARKHESQRVSQIQKIRARQLDLECKKAGKRELELNLENQS